MLKRAVMLTTMIVAFSASSVLFAGDFTINAPKQVTVGDTLPIGIAVDQSSAKSVKLSVFASSTGDTSAYIVPLVNGVGKQDHTFNVLGSVILKVEDANNPKSFNTQILHVQPSLGGRP